MAATALTSTRPDGRGLARALTSVYLAIWALTALVATVIALLARRPARGLMGLRLDAAPGPPPGLAAVLGLAAHNLPICAWPLLIGSLRLEHRSSWRHVLDVTVLACALANVLPVACALGGYTDALLPYVPQLPLEWAALAVGYGSWMLERRRPLARTQRLHLLGVLSALLLAAAALESYAVPHRRSKGVPASCRAQINGAEPTGRDPSAALLFQPQQGIARSTSKGPRQAPSKPKAHPCHGRLGR